MKLISHDANALLTSKNPLYQQWVRQFTELELAKDKGQGDITTRTLFRKKADVFARVIMQEDGILAGRQEVEFFLKRRLRCIFLKKDGEAIRKGDTIAIFKGDVRTILEIERTVLNLLGRMSAVATLAARILAKVRAVNKNVSLALTRKTLWGLLDKRAASLGGFKTHRLNLNDAILIKDNHLDFLGRDIPAAIAAFFPLNRSLSKLPRFFEIEVTNTQEALTAAQTIRTFQKRFRLPSFIMLDNFSVREVANTIALLKKRGLASHVQIEASGGITGKNVLSYARAGVNIISLGEITKNAGMLDFALECSPGPSRDMLKNSSIPH